VTGRRAVITGVGVRSPGGSGKKEFWDLLSSGRTATRRSTLFDASAFRCQIAAECDFDPIKDGLSPREASRMDRVSQLAVVCTREAIVDSGLAPGDVPPERMAVSIGNAVGNTMSMEAEYSVGSDSGRLWLGDLEYLTRHAYWYMVPSSIASEVAWASGAEGSSRVVSTGCTSGLDSIGYALDLIREGSADVVITGATEAPLSPITMAGFDALRATTSNNADPEHACRPFDRDRDGIVIGEGAAVFVLEERERARRRGAPVYGEVIGYGGRANAYHMTGLKADGRELAEAVRVALNEARVNPADIDYVNAHGSGTKQNDRHETAALKISMGEQAYRVPISSIKSMIGHSLGAIGSQEVAACLLAMEYDVVPPTANLHNRDPECDLDYVPLTAREHPVDLVLSVASGFGGFQTAIVLASPDASGRR
jgi:act minimal PKS ketosynthase (KS/KS alpha)